MGPSFCTPGTAGLICRGNTAIQCNSDGSEAGTTDCFAMGQVCTDGVGCTVCQPNRFACNGDAIQQCNAQGTALTPTGTVCDSAGGQMCNALTGTCVTACDPAVLGTSYIGCEYWPTPTVNDVYDRFSFAVVVANPQTAQANVVVTGGGLSGPMPVPVAPGSVATITLPWVPALKAPGRDDTTDPGLIHPQSVQVGQGAYHLVSSLPVTVYQFNALEYRIDGDCPDGVDPDPTDGACFSYSNDASLLLPTNVLTGRYIVSSYPTRMQRISAVDSLTGQQLDTSNAPGQQDTIDTWTPGFFAIIGVESAPTSVSITFTSHVAASADGRVRAFNPGDTGTFTLAQGEVLQIASAEPTSCPGSSMDTQADPTCGTFGCDVTTQYCDIGNDYDLTGTVIQAEGRVMVIGGHECAFVPHNRWACDHIEETLYPLDAWGHDVVVSATQPLRSEPNVIRVTSGADGNMITFDPASAHAPVTLNRGQTVEFESGVDVHVTATQAMLVSQFLVGQDYAGVGTSGTAGNGDPSLSLGIPTEQFRTSYSFLAPSTYEQSWVNVTAPSSATVTIDGTQPVSGWRPVGASGLQTARVMVGGGAHSITGTAAFGIVVYGFGSYTSYMYPGGLELNQINPPF